MEEAVQEKRRLIEDCKELQDRKFLLLCALLKVKEEVEGIQDSGAMPLSKDILDILDNMRTLCPIIYHTPFSYLQPFNHKRYAPPLNDNRPTPFQKMYVNPAHHIPDRLQRQADFLEQFVSR